MNNESMAELLSRQITAQSSRLYRLAYSYVKNEQDAMDIVQDAAYKLLKHAGRIRRQDQIETWLYRVTVNTALDFLRKHKRVTVGLPEAEEGRPDDHSRLYLLDLLDRLDPKSRTVLLLKYFEDMTFAQIAEILDENVNTVKSRLYQALRILKLEEDQHA